MNLKFTETDPNLVKTKDNPQLTIMLEILDKIKHHSDHADIIVTSVNDKPNFIVSTKLSYISFFFNEDHLEIVELAKAEPNSFEVPYGDPDFFEKSLECARKLKVPC